MLCCAVLGCVRCGADAGAGAGAGAGARRRRRSCCWLSRLSSCCLFRLSRAVDCWLLPGKRMHEVEEWPSWAAEVYTNSQRFSLFAKDEFCLRRVSFKAWCRVRSKGVDFHGAGDACSPVSAFLFVTSFIFSVFRWRQRVALARALLYVVKLQTRRLLLCYLGLLWCSAGAKEMTVLRAVSSCMVSRAVNFHSLWRHTASLCVSRFVISIVYLLFRSKQCVVSAWGRLCCCHLQPRCLLLCCLGLLWCTADARTWPCCVQAVSRCWLPKGEAYVRD
jgi:hypothetical protein